MTTTHLSLEEYLRTDYEPDCDYIDGELEQRNASELNHSLGDDKGGHPVAKTQACEAFM